ncbi:MAG: MFS transporter [Candidatus Rokuibacteriota bacterium]
MVGLSFASQSTILPAFAAHLGASNMIIGAIPALMTLGWFLPSLPAAHHTRGLARKLPLVLRYTAAERVPFLVLAVLAFATAERAPAFTLTATLAMLLVFTGTGGALMPAWLDIVARAIPPELRGRFFGLSNSLAGVGGLLGSLGTAWILAHVAPPAGYGWCFLVATIVMGLSWVALALVREPAGTSVPEALPLQGFLRLVLSILKSDGNLAWFLAARACTGLASMSSGFFTVYALRSLAAQDWQVGFFTSALLAGHVVGNAALGWLADRVGHRVVLMSGLLATFAANLVALATESLEIYSLAFALSGVNQAAVSVSGQTILLDFAATAEERPTYVGLGNTALAPVFFGAPLLAGLMADTLGVPSVFVLALGGALLGTGLFAWRVRDPAPPRAIGA